LLISFDMQFGLYLVSNNGSSLFPVGNLVRRVEPFKALRYACSRSNPT